MRVLLVIAAVVGIAAADGTQAWAQAAAPAAGGSQPAGAEETENSIRQALAVFSGRDDVYLLSLALVSMSQQRYDDAAVLVDKAIAANGTSPEAWVVKGNLLAIAGRDADALAAFTRGIDLGTFWVTARLYRSDVYSAQGNTVAAIADLSEVLRKTPDDSWALNNRAWNRIIAKDYAGAIDDATQSVKLDPAPSALDTRGWALYHAGRKDEALADARAALDKDPNEVSSRVLVFRITADGGDSAGALSALRAWLSGRAAAGAEDVYIQTARFLGGDAPLADLRANRRWQDVRVLLRGIQGID
jgi:tetratricopeptide (TPR) repeat protein